MNHIDTFLGINGGQLQYAAFNKKLSSIFHTAIFLQVYNDEKKNRNLRWHDVGNMFNLKDDLYCIENQCGKP